MPNHLNILADTQDADKSSAEAEKIVNARRALADRLKREVIQQKK